MYTLKDNVEIAYNKMNKRIKDRGKRVIELLRAKAFVSARLKEELKILEKRREK